MATPDFQRRHIGPSEHEQKEMLQTIGFHSLDALIEATVPGAIRLKSPLNLDAPMSEFEYLNHLKGVAAHNKTFDTYIGLGYYNTITPSVIRRNIFENPGWYTAYTPYQAEVAQGRLEALLNFQTMVSDLTGMPIANASLLDEGTAAGEAMIMFYNNRTKEQIQNGADTFLVSSEAYPQTIDVLKTRAVPLGIKLEIADPASAGDKVFGVLLQYPCISGSVEDYSGVVQNLKLRNIKVAVATDLMALVLLTPPGKWGADVALGNSQRFGVPMGYGGPHAAFFATTDEFKRNMPGRIIGVSKDSNGKPALRMALQTREQHIRRDKATSNICTAQALLAVMSGMYACYHGPQGLKNIAQRIAGRTTGLKNAIEQLGYKILNRSSFDTITCEVSQPEELRKLAESECVNLRYNPDNTISISLDETTTLAKAQKLANILAQHAKKNAPLIADQPYALSQTLLRNDQILSHPVFNRYHSETLMMRYMKKLENKDVSLVHSMIALGSCTMKLNAATQLIPLMWPEFAGLHPFIPVQQAAGYHQIFDYLNQSLSEITGFAAMSLQPNSGAQGEYAGLMVIRAYHEHRGQGHRNVALIPSSAHGTNPASAVMAGMKVVVVACDPKGNIDVSDLKAKAEQYSNDLSCLMVTYPSTHGVFEESIIEITDVIHRHGGQVYMDGANMNAQVGLTSPGRIGADVCHLNLHKTFAIPHGGGGPGMGPIGVASHLVPFLPGNPVVKSGGEHAITAISAAPFGSALILLISYGYIKMLGASGLKNATEIAILNANYMKKRLESHYPILYTGTNNTVAHEMILDCRNFKKAAGIEVEDLAKRLMDYGFHAPTVSFPVAGTLMVEPTESEAREELDRFCDALIEIRNEVDEIEKGIQPHENNCLKNAPHTASVVLSDTWNQQYSRTKAAFALPWIAEAKFWPSVGRVDNAHGDRNLICTCPPLEEYMETVNH